MSERESQMPLDHAPLGEEVRVYSPSEAFSKASRVSSMQQYEEMYRRSIADPETFWAEEAEQLTWHKKWDRVLKWEAPNAEWFVGGTLNIAENCLDRHLQAGRAEKVAFYWEGEDGERRTYSYRELHREVCKAANALLQEGLQIGERVLIYLPMIPEALTAMLACARIGAVHTVVFAGFSSDAIRERLRDCGATFVITADGSYRRGKHLALKEKVDKALRNVETVRRCLVVRRSGQSVTMLEERDRYWDEALAEASPVHQAAPFSSEHPLFILYTSGSTGKPKGILHTTGGYMVGTHSSCQYIMDLQEEDVYWCSADVGWITGHSYICYGPLLSGVTQVLYEGAPDYPDFGRFWQIVERYKVSMFYTAPTAIRAFIRAGDHFPASYNLSSLRLLGSVGEPINPEVWVWYHKVIGAGRCPIVDTWWQTETGMIMISPLPGATSTIPGCATRPFFGVDAVVLDEEGNQCLPGVSGRLVVRKPWPSMLRGIYGDAARFRETYWNRYEGYYFAGDGAQQDEEGNITIIGRLDDVMNVSGHRLGTAEIEGALVSHDAVAEAAVIGKRDPLKGQAITAFVVTKAGSECSNGLLRSELKEQVVRCIGALARPQEVVFVKGLPKTRSGKIMRRLLKELAETGVVSGNLSTLEDHTVIKALQEQLEQPESNDKREI